MPREQGGNSPIIGGEKAPSEPTDVSSLSFIDGSSLFFKDLRSLALRFWNQILTYRNIHGLFDIYSYSLREDSQILE